MMRWRLNEGATTILPTSVLDVKNHTRIDLGLDDAYVESLISAATDWVERFLNRVLIRRDISLTLDRFPIDGRSSILLPRAVPLISVTAFNYTPVGNSDARTASLSENTDFLVDTSTGGDLPRIYPAYNKSWPSVNYVRNAVRITYCAGVSSGSSLPGGIIQAIWLLCAHYYENREAATPVQLSQIPHGVKSLLRPHRLRPFARIDEPEIL